jgi:hypothetical protein
MLWDQDDSGSERPLPGPLREPVSNYSRPALGSRGFARAYYIIDAKLFAVPRCERCGPVPVCILVWCRPGR